MVFSAILDVDVPTAIEAGDSGKNPAFEIVFIADGEIPFPQVVIHDQGRQHLVVGDAIRQAGTDGGRVRYVAAVPEDLFRPGQVTVQIEGCRKADIREAGGGDWVKKFRPVTVTAPKRTLRRPRAAGTPGPDTVKVYFGIHKHMHQPYYNTTDTAYWDGEKESIFGSRWGNYTDFVPAAVRQYIDGGLPHGGLSTSWSGSLIEQLDRCNDEGLCGGAFRN